MTASEVGECCRHCTRNDVVVFEDADGDFIASSEVIEVAQECIEHYMEKYFGANIMDGDYDRIKVKEVTDVFSLVKRMREARHRYSALSREFCSKGMKPRQSQEWQDARKLTKRLESEVDEYLGKIEK